MPTSQPGFFFSGLGDQMQKHFFLFSNSSLIFNSLEFIGKNIIRSTGLIPDAFVQDCLMGETNKFKFSLKLLYPSSIFLLKPDTRTKG